MVGRDPEGRTAHSDFVGPHGGTFQQYFRNQYGVSLQHPNQPLFVACQLKPDLRNALLLMQIPPECKFHCKEELKCASRPVCACMSFHR
ncbi:unnamed protein product [Closterium sp. NIES-53]